MKYLVGFFFGSLSSLMLGVAFADPTVTTTPPVLPTCTPCPVCPVCPGELSPEALKAIEDAKAQIKAVQQSNMPYGPKQ